MEAEVHKVEALQAELAKKKAVATQELVTGNSEVVQLAEKIRQDALKR